MIESTIVPMLLRQYRDNVEMAERYLILCTMVAIIQARKIVFGASTGDDKDGKDFFKWEQIIKYLNEFQLF